MNPSKPRLLILTAGYGEGHNAAARALAVACDAAHGPGSAKVVDAFALAAPRFNALSRRSYLSLINRLPRAWSATYAWVDRSKYFPRLLGLLRGERRVIAETLAADAPAAICSTYPLYAFLIEPLARRGLVRAPHYNVVTDSISINSLWWRAGAAGWFLPNEDSAEVLRRAGVDAARLHVLGFPVTPFFSAHAAEFSPPDPAAGAAPRVLHIVHSGTKHASETARALFAQEDWEITCAVGRDEALRRQLTRWAEGRRRPATILGWTDQIPRLLMTHHVVVSKAGGATTQEAIAARCPMLVNQIVPGQEEGNYELLRRHGTGALAETPAAIVAALQRAFADRARVWREWRAALAPLARPDAARDIVAHALAATSSAPAMQRTEAPALPAIAGSRTHAARP
ncbi:MAG TPA: galactosyldiacylglycerol synthase [Opitutaceae bacterium]|nr:galactosyldiacylglycerol synthase [Opitutaceae bacterium]